MFRVSWMWVVWNHRSSLLSWPWPAVWPPPGHSLRRRRRHHLELRGQLGVRQRARSAGDGSVRGNGGAAECKDARASHQPLDASSPLSAGIFVAQTESVGDRPATQVAKAGSGVAELRVRSLPILPVELPALTIDDALGSVSVPLTVASTASRRRPPCRPRKTQAVAR